MYRQGDVLVVRVDRLPEDAVAVKGRVILAEGELTGHAHEIVSEKAELFELSGERFLRLTGPATLAHQEHAPISLPVGVYRVIRQREYSLEAIRNVAD